MQDLITLLTLTLALVSAVGGIAATLRNFRKIQQVHVLVNSQKTALEIRIVRLEETIKAEGLELPPGPLSA